MRVDIRAKTRKAYPRRAATHCRVGWLTRDWGSGHLPVSAAAFIETCSGTLLLA